jgi:ABC-2 type transport system permease protein
MKQKEYKRGIKYYLDVWRAILKNSFKSHNTYKLDVVIRFLRTIFILLVQLVIFNAIFGDQEYFIGWSKSEAYLIAGFWNLLNYSGWALFGVNLLEMSGSVMNGRFDFVILKPLSSVFLASFNDFNVSNFITTMSGVFLVGYYFVVNWGSIEWLNVFVCCIAMLFSLVIWFAVYLLANSFTLKTPKNAFWQVAKEVLGVTKYPVDIFGSSLQWVFYTFFPIAFITTVPAKILTGRMPWWWVFISFGVSVLLLFSAIRVWKWNLKRYASSGG